MIALNGVFSYAVRNQLIDHNPARDLEKPRGKGGELKTKARILEPEEIKP